MNSKISIFFFFCSLLFTVAHAQDTTQTWQFDCQLGFNYEISNNQNWGQNEPVVTYVAPGSPAYFAGLKVNDIIMQVRCDATYLRDSLLIDRWLKKESDVLNNQITIRNFDNNFTEYNFHKICKTVNSLSEEKLSSMFSEYSPKNSYISLFTMPIRVVPMDIPEHDYSDYHTFNFASPATVSPSVQDIVIAQFEEMGIKQDKVNPDFLVKLDYSVKNKMPLEDRPLATISRAEQRYNKKTKQLEKYKISISDEYDFQEGNISIEFVENKIIDTTKYTTIWKADISEDFTGNIIVPQYLETYIPLMLMQFPYTKACNYVTFRVDVDHFLYTGIDFDGSDMQKIAELDPYGPAAQAGIYLGYKILKINDIPLPSSLGEIELKYTNFLNLSQLMDANTTSKEKDNKKKTDMKNSGQVLSYLFSFDKAVDPSYNGEIEFEVTNGTRKRKVKVKPELRQYNTITVVQ